MENGDAFRRAAAVVGRAVTIAASVAVAILFLVFFGFFALILAVAAIFLLLYLWIRGRIHRRSFREGGEFLRNRFGRYASKFRGDEGKGQKPSIRTIDVDAEVEYVDDSTAFRSTDS